MADLRDETIEVLAAQDPRRVAEGTLQVLMPHLLASASGLFRGIPGQRLLLFASVSVTQTDIDRANEAWDDAQESILCGHPYTDDSYALVPVGGAGILY